MRDLGQHPVLKSTGSVFACFGFGLLFFAALFIFRNTGIHIDEGNYFEFAKSAPTGDSLMMGKPPLFYQFNYALFHNYGSMLGPFQPWTVPLFYIVVTVLAITFTTRVFQVENKRFLLLFAVMCTSPLVVLNATMLMMETFVLPAVILAASSLADFRNRKLVALLAFVVSFFAITFAIAVKETALIPFGVFALGSLLLLKKRSIVFFAAIWFGIKYRQETLAALKLTQHHQYWPEDFVYNIPTIAWDRLGYLWQYLVTWAHYIGPALLAVGFLVLVVRRKGFKTAFKEDRLQLLLGIILIGTAFGAMSAAVASQYLEIVRYAYPSMFAGVVVAYLLMASFDLNRLMKATLVFNITLLITMYIFSNDSKFLAWPKVTVRELYRTGGTTFSDISLHAWAMRNIDTIRDQKMCFLINEKGGEETLRATVYLKTLFGDRFEKFDEKTEALFQNCEGIKISYMQRHPIHGIDPCEAGCPSWSAWGECQRRNLTFFSRHPKVFTGAILNNIPKGLLVTQACFSLE